MNWICSQIGARQHYFVAQGLHCDGLLDVMFTDCWSPRFLKKLPLPGNAARSFAGRNSEGIPPDKVIHINGPAIAREAWFRLRRKWSPGINPFEFYNTHGSWFAKWVAKQLAARTLDPTRHCFHGFTTGSLETLELIRDRGIPSVLQQIDAGRVHYEVVAEAKLWPGWQRAGMNPPEDYFVRSEKEWETASVVVVNSRWARDALTRQGVPADKMVVLPLYYDFPPGLQSLTRDWKTPLKVLWAAEVVLGKGIKYLLEAARRLAGRNITFVVAGTVGISREAVASAPASVKFLGRVPRAEIHRYYSESHVFVFPTLSDGFGLTQLEALAHGLPVIATPNCGDVVSDGIDGYIVPARDAAALAEAIARLDDDRDLLCRMAAMTGEKVRKFSLTGYGKRLTKAVAQVLNGKSRSNS